jgi:hypothetical protein
MKYGADPSFVPVAVHAFFKGFFRYIRGIQPGFTAGCGGKNRKTGIARFFAVFNQEPYVFAFGGIVDNELL